jgi:hypothetical protein
MQKKIKIKKIEDHTERAIILLLKERGKCRMGDILMNLKLGYRKGYRYLDELNGKKWIRIENGPYYRLQVDVE